MRCVGGVREVGVLALGQLEVLRVERHPPADLAGGVAGGRRPRAYQSSSFENRPAVGVAERDEDRAGERGEVDDPLGALLDRVAERVGQDQAALGVGVVDLDRLAVHRGDDVARLHRAWPLGMFSVDGTTAVTVAGSAELGDRVHRLDHRGAAGHVELHLLHLRRGLDRDPAGVEGHGLAHEARGAARWRRRAGSAARSAAARRALPWATAAKRAHAARHDRVAVEQLDLERLVLRRRSPRRARRGTSGVATLAGRF